MRCFKINRRGAIMVQRAFPARDAYAPLVARFQSRETPFRMRRDKVISVEHREIEKFLRHFYADGVKPNVFRSRAAKTVAVKSGHRIATTTFQLASQNIRRHGAILALEIALLNVGLVKTFVGSGTYSSSMKRIAIAYWLLPAEPARSFFQEVINHLARRYGAPPFEPHLTIHVGSNRAGTAEKALSMVARDCKLVTLKMLEIDHSSEFMKTLFVQYGMTAQLQQLNQSIRTAAQDSSDYRLNPHLSLLYKRISNHEQRLLTRSIEVPFMEVKFDSLKAIRCISPTQNSR